MTASSNVAAVSVVTPLYNSAAHIRDTLDGLCSQSYEQWECILVNDGSTDNTVEIIKPYLADSRFKYVAQENAGIAAARNAGIRHATGEWLCLLDHDDRWLPSKLENQLAFAAEHGVAIVCTGAIAVQERSRTPYSEFYAKDYIAALEQSATDPQSDVYGLLIRHNFLCASSVMLKRSLFGEFGLFDPAATPADDYDMWLRCGYDHRIGYLKDPLVEYNIHAGNISHDFRKMIERTIYAVQKAADRHRGDSLREKQFGDSLIALHHILLTDLVERREYGAAIRHAAGLITSGSRGRRRLRWVVDSRLLRALGNSLVHEAHSHRSIYGEGNLESATNSTAPRK